MKIGIIGGGSVGQTIARKLLANGHDVLVGIRNPSPEELAKERSMAQPLADWIAETGGKVGTFAQAAAHGDIIFNVTNGQASIAALTLAGRDNIDDKILIDVANPLDFSNGMPPDLLKDYSYGTSLGEEIQKAFPKARVVKAFNTVSAFAMVDANFVKGDHDLIIAGNDEAAILLVHAPVSIFCHCGYAFGCWVVHLTSISNWCGHERDAANRHVDALY
jgi:8-hydroxy-5-deazaflavin:NADPH oxidoreductase